MMEIKFSQDGGRNTQKYLLITKVKTHYRNPGDEEKTQSILKTHKIVGLVKPLLRLDSGIILPSPKEITMTLLVSQINSHFYKFFLGSNIDRKSG